LAKLKARQKQEARRTNRHFKAANKHTHTLTYTHTYEGTFAFYLELKISKMKTQQKL